MKKFQIYICALAFGMFSCQKDIVESPKPEGSTVTFTLGEISTFSPAEAVAGDNTVDVSRINHTYQETDYSLYVGDVLLENGEDYGLKFFRGLDLNNPFEAEIFVKPHRMDFSVRTVLDSAVQAYPGRKAAYDAVAYHKTVDDTNQEVALQLDAQYAFIVYDAPETADLVESITIEQNRNWRNLDGQTYKMNRKIEVNGEYDVIYTHGKTNYKIIVNYKDGDVRAKTVGNAGYGNGKYFLISDAVEDENGNKLGLAEKKIN